MTPALDHRQNNFDFLRFFLAALVIFSHSFDLLSGTNKTNPFKIATGGQIELATLAVNLFFILSGYLIAQSWLTGRGVADFFKKRVLRIYPAFVVACLLGLLLFSPLGMKFYGYLTPSSPDGYWRWVDWPMFLFHLITLQTLWVPHSFQNPMPVVNSAIWTIHYEFLCYILVAILGVTQILKRRYVILALFALTFAFHLVHHYGQITLYRQDLGYGAWQWGELPIGGKPDCYPEFFTYFLAGAVFYLFRDRIRFTLPLALASAALVLAGLFLFRGAEIVMPLCGAYLALGFAFSRQIPLQRWGRFGDFSYGLYVFGWPIQQSVIHFMGRDISPITLFLFAFPITLILAVGSWHVIERPFLRLKNRTPRPAPRNERIPEPVSVTVETRSVLV